MPQPTRREKAPAVRKKKVKKTTPRGKRPHPKYGTSKLEDRFAVEFLDRLGYKYIRQYEAREIGRFYDFCIIREDGKILALIVINDCMKAMITPPIYNLKRYFFSLEV